MPPETDSKPWDFSQALELINALSSPPLNTGSREPAYSLSQLDDNGDGVGKTGTTPETRLGDFSRLWEYLGQPYDTPSPSVPALTTLTPPDRPSYISDGAIYQPTSTKAVRWRDETEDNASLTDGAAREAVETPKQLTKTQRKKARRRARAEAAARQRTASDFESEADLPRAPARKASVHRLATQEEQPHLRYNLRPRTPSGYVITPTQNFAKYPDQASTFDATELAPAQPTSQDQWKHDTPVKLRALNGSGHFPAPQSLPVKAKESLQRQADASWTPTPTIKVHPSQQLQAALQAGYQHQLPAHIAHTTSPAFNIAHQQPLWLQPGFLHPPSANSVTKLGVKPQRTKPLVIREGDDRNLALRLKLIHDFGRDKKWLTSPVPLANHTRMPNGIHVLIDYSNIWIGFMELVKQLTGLHPQARTPLKNMSFDSLVLLLERGRPVAKRVLAGSAPFLPAFETARAIGYELNILDKVFKAKELTERQRRFASKSGNGGATTTDEGSGSETGTAANSASYAPERWVEQGVDEILHLKLLESIVDAADSEVSTIVLATGDAAEAEYSAGFMKMVERALKKGWKVELASWSKGMSHLYSRKEFLDKWQEYFTVVDLDDFAEYLIDS